MAEEVLAPLAGKVLSLAVEVGATVEEDDEVLVLEAMKMETVVYAPCDGEVTAIMVKVGDQVEEDDPLATIECPAFAKATVGRLGPSWRLDSAVMLTATKILCSSGSSVTAKASTGAPRRRGVRGAAPFEE